MAILKYSEVRDKASTLRAMTSLDRAEFDKLAEAFSQAWDAHQERAGRNRAQGGWPEQLKRIEDKLFFILFYLKSYPLQEVLGHLFGLSQGQANVWVHRLSEVLQTALTHSGHAPARLPEEMLARLAEEAPQRFAIDGTERRIQRPQDDAEQRQYYSGKKKPTQ